MSIKLNLGKDEYDMKPLLKYIDVDDYIIKKNIFKPKNIIKVNIILEKKNNVCGDIVYYKYNPENKITKIIKISNKNKEIYERITYNQLKLIDYQIMIGTLEQINSQNNKSKLYDNLIIKIGEHKYKLNKFGRFFMQYKNLFDIKKNIIKPKYKKITEICSSILYVNDYDNPEEKVVYYYTDNDKYTKFIYIKNNKIYFIKDSGGEYEIKKIPISNYNLTKKDIKIMKYINYVKLIEDFNKHFI